MNDKDREAFELVAKNHGWPIERYVPGYFLGDEEGFYKFIQDHWIAYQAARDHYLPKVTERAFKAIVSEAIWDDDSEGRVLSRVLEALRAAGVRFRDEA
jgi:hypothetical protein